MVGVTYEAAVIGLPPAAAPCSPTIRRRPMQDLSWFRGSRQKSPKEAGAAAAASQSTFLAHNLPSAQPHQSPQLQSPSKSGYKATESRVETAPGRGQLVETRAAPKLAQRATDGVSRMLSSLKRKGAAQRCPSDTGSREEERRSDQLMAATCSRTTRPPLSSADVQNLRRRAYSYNDRHVDSIYQTLLMAGGATPAAERGREVPPLLPASPRLSAETQCGGTDASVSKATARLLMTFPDMAGELSSLRNFACTLDHAGMRWYGRIFVGRSCLCFTGTGITLSGATSTGRASPPPPSERWCSEEPACASLRSLSSTSNRTVRPTTVALDRCQWPASSLSSASLAASSRPESPLSKPCSGHSRPWRKTALKIPFHDITRVSKELTMGLWPNAMTLATRHRQYIFTNFLRRDRAHQCLSEAWQQQGQALAEKYPLVVARLPLESVASRTAVQKSLPKPFAAATTTRPAWRMSLPPPSRSNSTRQQQPPVPATPSACESESTICERPAATSASLVSRQRSARPSRPTTPAAGLARSRLNEAPTTGGRTAEDVDAETAAAASMLALILHSFCSRH
ncbi:hypothetical protein GGF42_007572, partial [Coemansia sp. RSA 2424]